MKIHNFKSLDHLFAEVFYELEQIKNDPNNFIMLSGGNSPKKIFEYLNLRSNRYDKINFIMSDERIVKKSSTNSNEGNFCRICPNLRNNLIPITSKSSRKKIKEHTVFDISILGFSDDGHTASIFPDDKNLKDILYADDFFYKTNSSSSNYHRVTFGLKKILNSKKIILLSTTHDKKCFLLEGIRKKYDLPVFKLLESERSEVFSIS